MTATTAHAIRKPQTNLSVVTDIMEYSRFGALSQAFVMAALESYRGGPQNSEKIVR